MARWWILLGAINGFLAVTAGAFAAHGLKQRLTPDLLAVFETAARYHMYHALALLAVGWLAARNQGMLTTLAGGCFLVGIILFSGSLYALVLTHTPRLGAVTPFGGTLLLVGWLLLAVAGWKPTR